MAKDGSRQPKVYFRKVTRQDNEKISLDADMIRVLIAIDEKKELARIAKEVGMDPSALNRTLKKLLVLKLIEPVKKDVSYLETAFISALKTHLSQAVGPMAEILIEDVVSDMGLSLKAFPQNQAPELINILAIEIPDEEARILFKKAMLAIITRG